MSNKLPCDAYASDPGHTPGQPVTWGFSAEAAEEVEVSLPSTSASVCGLVHPTGLYTNSSQDCCLIS